MSLDPLRPFLIENYPESIRQKRWQSCEVTLSDELTVGIGRRSKLKALFLPYECCSDQDLAQFEYMLKEVISLNYDSGGSFIRTGAAAPLDSKFAQKKKFRAKSGADVIDFLADSKGTMQYFIANLKEKESRDAKKEMEAIKEATEGERPMPFIGKKEPSIWLSKWQYMKPEEEFRCFIKDKVLMGISQYHCKIEYPSVVKHAESIYANINDFFMQHIQPHLHVPDCMMDMRIWIDESDQALCMRFIDLNPWGVGDSKLFKWQEPFTSTIRYIKGAAVMETGVKTI